MADESDYYTDSTGQLVLRETGDTPYHGDQSDYSMPKTDYSLSGGAGSSYGGINVNDVTYTPSDGIRVKGGGGEGLDVNDYTYKPGVGFVYTGGGGTGSGMSFSGTDTLGNPTSIDARNLGSRTGSVSGAGKLSGIAKQAADALKKKTESLGGIGDLLMSLLALKYATSGGMKPQIAGYKGPGPNLALRAVQPTNVIPTRAYGAGAVGQPYQSTTYAAQGGIMGLAAGGAAKPPRYLDGPTDGMADKINTDIDGTQAAKLSHGEFVIPADVVSHLGNGNSKAGADVLYKMMDRVRKARTGTTKQGKQINPAKFTPGGIAGYAGGGAVAFDGGGGVTTSGTNPGTGTSTTSGLNEYAGPYVTNMLSQANALGDQGYQAYTGPLTAGTSPLQQQAFTGFQGLNTNYNPVAGSFTGQTAQQYMNPYLSATLGNQLSELNRQNQISQLGQQAKLAQAGAFGGSRDAIMRAENERNLGQQQSNLINTAYSQAFDKAMGQFNTEQQNKINEAQFGAKYGIDALNAQQTAGAQQRAIEQQAIDAQRAQFEEAKAFPYKQLQFKQSMLQGLPLSTYSNTPNYSQYDDIRAAIAAIFGPLGNTSTQP